LNHLVAQHIAGCAKLAVRAPSRRTLQLPQTDRKPCP
jgi:hypothetical protein